MAFLPPPRVFLALFLAAASLLAVPACSARGVEDDTCIPEDACNRK